MRELHYLITTDDSGKPVSRIARGRLSLSYHLFAQLKLQNAVLIDGAPVRANYVVKPGERLTILLPEVREMSSAPPEDLPINIVYQDEDLLIIDKPAPLPCQSTDRQRHGTLENRLAHSFGEGFVFRPINRLDKGTSGLMATALHPHAQMLLTKQLHTPAFLREYQAVAVGHLPQKEGVIDAPIGKADGATVRREVRQDGKPARTHYRVLSECDELSLVALRLETGRTHQIRVHLAHIGCPIYGDFLYGEERCDLPNRFALHSHKISLKHPISGEILSFSSALPPEIGSIMTPYQSLGG